MEELDKILSYFKFSDENNSDTESFLRRIAPVVEAVDIDLIADPSNFIESSLYPLICKAGVNMKESGVLMDIYQKCVLATLKKIVTIFAERTRNPYDLSLITKYLAKKIPALFKRNNSYSFAINFSDSSNNDRT